MVPLPKAVIDNHVHLWEPEKVYIPWLNQVEQLNKTKDLADYFNQSKDLTDIKSIVYVETDVGSHHGLVEANWITNTMNTASSKIDGLVLFAPINQGEHVKNYIELLLKMTQNKLKGVRYLIQDPNRYDEMKQHYQAFINGVQCLENYRLSFDITINSNDHPEQFEYVQLLVSQCPRVQFILDHMGKPPCDSSPGESRFEYWATQIRQLARNENISCKISGLLTELKSEYKSRNDIIYQLKPFVDTVKEAFGKDRILFGSDWPMCELKSTELGWSSWLEIVCEIIKDWPEEDKEKFFVTNAIRFYQLKQ